MLIYIKYYFEKIKFGKSKGMQEKSVHVWYMMWIEKTVTRDHCSASFGKPRDADK